jgi:hypothetical protein
LTTRERILGKEKEDWGDSIREAVLSLQLVAKHFEIKFGYFFLDGGDTPEIVANWSGGPELEGVLAHARAEVFTEIPVILRRHASVGVLKDLEAKPDSGAVEVVFALNRDKAMSPDQSMTDLAHPLNISVPQAEVKADRPPDPPAKKTQEEFLHTLQGFREFLVSLLDEEIPEEENTPEDVKKLLEDFSRPVVDAMVKQMSHAIAREYKLMSTIRVGFLLMARDMKGLPQELVDALWQEASASPLMLLSWEGGPEANVLKKFVEKKVDSGGVPILLYRYSKADPSGVDPISLLKANKAAGQYAVTRGAVN